MSDPCTTRDDNLDTDLRASFAGLRERDAIRAPSIARTLARRTRPRPRTLAIAGIATAMAAVIAVILVIRSDREGTYTGPIAAWRAPSDALLEMTRPAGFENLQSRGTSALNTLVPVSTPFPTPSGPR